MASHGGRLTAFHLFPQLPPELRETVWEFALWPPQVGSALFFSTCRRWKPLPESMAAYINPNAQEKTPLLITELNDTRSLRSMEDNLWGTYWEAREMVQLVRRKRARERAKERDRQQGPADLPTLSGRFKQGDREMSLTYTPERDMICFEKKDLKSILHWAANEPSMPPFLQIGFLNFALLYDESWSEFFQDPSPMPRYYRRRAMDGMLFRACCKSGAEAFWVIDRVPRPKTGSNALAGARVQYVGRRQRFVQVVNANLWDFGNSNSFIFVYRLERAVKTWLSLVVGNQGPLEYWSPPKKFGVLCCIEREADAALSE
ncbi:uncharacterized protein Triagg1_2611 [Trichoderma aggressivum f. europaeum]|uniref:2EXR domain-containing protein n=1 Tax=Trichoderma aggressivum f. europaeum TaxID=173218 RepID=A0AAE1IK58_9HYPO|nr:hypothetical protein Triagg1_2611 [Trichoderma aggressivum f. europaeum]